MAQRVKRVIAAAIDASGVDITAVITCPWLAIPLLVAMTVAMVTARRTCGVLACSPLMLAVPLRSALGCTHLFVVVVHLTVPRMPWWGDVPVSGLVTIGALGAGIAYASIRLRAWSARPAAMSLTAHLGTAFEFRQP